MKLMQEMKAILIEKFGSAENLKIGNWEKPQPKPQEILVKVMATALNRADILQREGKYPPPAGASPILGLELAGEVWEIGNEASKWQKGDKVFGLVPGGAYAEYAIIHEDMAIKIPDNQSFTESVAIPEVFLTAYQALVWLAKLQTEEKILIHAGASGVGTAAIQIAKSLGSEVFVTASASKHKLCKDLGASQTIDYQSFDFKELVLKFSQNQGVEVIIDFMGASYFEKNLDCLKVDGRMVLLALIGGWEAEKVNLGKILSKRLQIIGSTLRARNLAYQIKLKEEFWQFAQNKFKTGVFKPIIDSVFSWTQVIEAHRYMEANRNSGKIILEIN